MNIGIIGLGLMGRSLALNFERIGYSAAGYDLNADLEIAQHVDRGFDKTCLFMEFATRN